MRISRTTERFISRARRDGGAGFTLMEVVLAMTVIAMLAVLAFPFVRSNSGVAMLRARSAEIASLLRSDRNAALRLSRPTMVSIDARAGVIRSATSGVTIDLPSSITLRFSPEGAEGIGFDRHGRSSGGRIVLTARDLAYVVDVNSITAAVRVSEPIR